QNAKRDSLDQDFLSTAYVPLAQIHNLREDTTFEIRTATTPGALIPAVRDAMASVNKSASVQFTTLKQQADDSVLQEHLMAVLSGFFGGLALLLTAIGLYGVMAYVVTQRAHEIGIRVALGAQQTSILRLVMRDAAIVLLVGIAAGLLGSIWITRLVKGLLFGLTPNDPVTMALAIVALVVVALVATYIPARRAMKVDPMVALRYE
ncbi:MAG TPA: FtsX-like permease family protein, partial [Candidatus Acidoferrales bacterium]|nr:FtsX-like permease family protein [Candidatus Acidoferrales bacterium]